MRKAILYTLFLLASLSLNAAPRDIIVRHLGTEEGLSHYTVNAIYQDEFDFIWIGTMDGLNRFDGHKVRIFKPETDGENYETSGLRDNNIRQICGDQNGHLYIKGLNSVSEFDMKTSSFRMLEEDGVRYIFHDGSSLWTAGTNGIYRLEEEGFIQMFSFENANMSDAVIDCFIVTRNGDICISTNMHGFYRINSKGHIIQHVASGAANSIFEDSGSDIWIATRTDGVYIVRANGGIGHFRHIPGDGASLLHDNVRQVCEDRKGNFWLGTYGGICRFDKDRGTFTEYRYEIKHKEFNIRSVMSMICDRQGTLWLGSFYEGISYYNTGNEDYFFYSPEKGAAGKLGSPVVNSISEDRKGNLWIGTDGGGLSCLDKKTREFRTITRKNGLASDAVKSTLYDPVENAVYIASLRCGIDRYDIDDGTISNFGRNFLGGENTGIENIVAIKPYGKDSLLLATNYGLIVFDKRSGLMGKLATGFDKNYIAQVWDIETDNDNNLWFSTSSELYCYNPSNGSTKVYSFQDIASEYVNNNLNAILKDSKGRLWFGSSGSGVFLYDRESDSFSNIVPAGKIGNGYVTGLDEDKESGHIYISTNNGLAKFNPETNEIEIYNSANGFPLSGINDNSLFISSDGELFASDMNGLVSVKCTALSSRPRSYNVYISGLLVDNTLVRPQPDDRESILKEDILFQDRITLRPGHSAIGFVISNTDYMNNSPGLQVEYMLEGFDSDFIRASGSDHVTYTNLNAGNYKFVVRGTVPDPYGNFPSSETGIKVIPPFYKTPFFILLCVAAILAAVFYIIHAYTKSTRLRSLLDLEKKEKEYISTVNQEKLRFFTNISHEFRTPLTLIDGQLELILQRNDLKPSVYSRILNIYRNSRRLRRLVDEIIDIRKQESGKMKLVVSENDIMEFLKEIYVSFEEYAKYRKTSFRIAGPATAVFIPFDPVQMEKVFFNLLSNAFKFTKEGGHISIRAEEFSDRVAIEVSDDGAGITADYIGHVFERFFQDDKLNAKLSYSGSGIGLSLSKAIVEMHGGTISVRSEPEKETCFTVTLFKNPAFPENAVTLQESGSAGLKSIRHYSNDFNPEEFGPDPSSDKEKSAGMLIVEDNDEVREMLVQIFSPIYKVSSAGNGGKGIELAIKENPDIILSDVMMPGMSGFEMCRKLKNNMETSHIPIVLLTAKTAESQIVKGFQTGADDYVTKPFNVKILVARCNNLVEGRKRLQQKYLRQPDASVSMLSDNPREQAILEKAVDVVMQHIDDADFNIDMFAREMGLSRTYLFTKIKGLTGQSPNEFMSVIRLKQAAVRLKEKPDESMADIAYAFGFSSSSYFIKCFKDMFGMTPNNYRKNWQVKGQDASAL